MSSRIVSCLSGFSLLIGGLLTLVFSTIFAQIIWRNGSNANTPHQSLGLPLPLWLILNLLVVLGSVLVVVGLPAVNARLSGRVRWLGLVGLVLTLIAILMTGVFGFVLNIINFPSLDVSVMSLLTGQGTPVIHTLFIVDNLCFSVGTILFGLAAVRASSTRQFVGAGWMFIMAGLFNVAHLVSIPDLFWREIVSDSGKVLTIVTFHFGLAACGFVLLSLSGADSIIKQKLSWCSQRYTKRWKFSPSRVSMRRVSTMPSGMLYRLSGIALLLGTFLTVLFSSISFILFGANQLSYYLAGNERTMFSQRLVETVTGPLWLPVNLVILGGSMVLVAGLPGMYAYVAKRAGWLGLFGFILTTVAVLLVGVVNQALYTFVWPFIAPGAAQMLPTEQISPALEGFLFVASLLFSSGAGLLGLALLRAATLPHCAKVIGVALIVAAVCNAVHLVSLPDSMQLFITIGTIAGVFSFLLGLAVFGSILVSLAEAQEVRPSQIPPETGSSMPAAVLYRLSGFALLVGSVLAVLLVIYISGINLTPSVATSPYWVPVQLIALTATILLLLGLPGMFVRLVSPASWSGIIGFALTFCAVLVLGVIDMGLIVFGIPLIATFAPHLFNSIFVLYNTSPAALNAFYLVANLAFCVGAMLFGRAILRAAVLPHEFDIIGMGLIFAGPVDAIAGIINFVPTLGNSLWQFSQAASGISFIAFFLAMGVSGGALMLRTEKAGLIIGRPLLYGILTAGVVTSYVLVVGSIGVLVQQTRVALIVALFLIGLIAILFQPLRDRLQRAVNRLVYGERDNPYAVLSRLGKHMEATLAPEAVLPTIVETIARSLKLPYVAIILGQDDETIVAAAYGSQLEAPLHFPLTYHAQELGELVLAPRSPGESLTPADQRLLQDLAPQLGVAVNALRLTVDLQHSRERLVTAREEERRRLRRDLHDGLGPQLAALTLKLETARNRLAHEPLADPLFADLTARTQAAVADIRRLVYALRPPVLDELGLLAALREQALQYDEQLHIHLTVPQCLPPLSAAVEVAIYRVTQEALTNVVRHAHASHCDVHLAHDEQANLLRLDIQDDGCGLPAQRNAGVGLVSMRERAEELGGAWTMQSGAAGGTCIFVQLPYRLPTPTDAVERHSGSLFPEMDN